MNKHLFDTAIRSDLRFFVWKAFETVVPGTPYLRTWHVDAIVHQLMRVHTGEANRLLINQPPRSLKSACVSVAYVAWLLGHNPTKRVIVVSYSNDLASELHRQFRVVVDSDWYRSLFPKMRVQRDTGIELVTTDGGGRYATSVLGTLTGRGADLIIVDDPLKAEDANSKSARRRVNDWYSGTLVSRLNDKGKGAIVVVMQRLHEDDLAGHLLIQGGWQHVNLPAAAIEEATIPLGHGKVMIRRVGDILHPERENKDTLDRIKSEIGSLQYSAQYQQQPIPLEGNLLKREWIGWYETAPSRETGQVVQSWDIATTTGDTRDWSVCTTWLMQRRKYYLLSVWRGQLEFPPLKRKLIALAREHQPSTVLIEQAGPGLHLIQEFRTDPVGGVPVPIGITPQGDKLVRMEAQCARFEAGQVHLPSQEPWLSDLLHELLAFPVGRYDDQVDSVAQFLKWAEARHSHWFGLVGMGGKIFVAGKEWKREDVF